MKITIPFQRQFNDNVRRKKIKTLRDAKKKKLPTSKRGSPSIDAERKSVPKKGAKTVDSTKKNPKKTNTTQQTKAKRRDLYQFGDAIAALRQFSTSSTRPCRRHQRKWKE